MKSSTALGWPFALVALLALSPARATAQGSDRGLARLTLGSVRVSIDYGRPMLKGRNPLSLIGPGEIWRVGADAPTTFDSSADLNFDGVRVPKGRHYLVARYLAKGEWSLVFSAKPAEDYEPSAKLAEVPMQLETSRDPDNQLTIRLEGRGEKGTLTIAWGTLRLTGKFRVAK